MMNLEDLNKRFKDATITAYHCRVPVWKFAMEYIKHEVLLQKPYLTDYKKRDRAYNKMSKALGMPKGKVKMAVRPFRKMFYEWMLKLAEMKGSVRQNIEKTPQWVQVVELKLNMLPKALEEVSLKLKTKSTKTVTSPQDVLSLFVAYCGRHRALCSSELYHEMRLTLRCSVSISKLHVVWVSAQRVCMAQVLALSRAGDAAASAHLSPAAWSVVDIVLLYTDVDTHRLLTHESVTLYDELQALTTLFTLVQKHRVESKRDRDSRAARWTHLYQEYVSSGKVSSLVVLQRRWHELKLQTRERVLAHWRGPTTLPGPTTLHIDIAKRFPHVVTSTPCSWSQLVADELVFTARQSGLPGECSESESQQEDEDAEQEAGAAPAAVDDDVLLIEKPVEVIDVDSASDTEDKLVIDDGILVQTGNVKTKIKNDNKKITPQMSTKNTIVMAENDKNQSNITDAKFQEITNVNNTVAKCARISVASVDSINNRFLLPHTNNKNVHNEMGSIMHPITISFGQPQGDKNMLENFANNSASKIINNHMEAQGLCVLNKTDTNQTAAILNLLDPTKVSAKIILESDSDSELFDNQYYNNSDNFHNDGNDICNAFSKLDHNIDKMETHNNENNVNNEDDASTATSENGKCDTKEGCDREALSSETIDIAVALTNGINTNCSNACDINEMDIEITNSDIGIAMGGSGKVDVEVPAYSNCTDDIEEPVAGKTNVAADSNNAIGCGTTLKHISGDPAADTNSATVHVTGDVIKAEHNYGTASCVTPIEPDVVCSARNDKRGYVDITPEPILLCSGGHEIKNEGLDVTSVDSKLIMNTQVALVRLHDTEFWKKHSTEGKFININNINSKVLQLAKTELSFNIVPVEFDEMYLKKHLGNDDDYETDPNQPDSSENESPADSLVDKELADHSAFNQTSSASFESFDNNHSHLIERKRRKNSESSDDDLPISELQCPKRRFRSAVQSMASSVLQWSPCLDKVFCGEETDPDNVGSRKKRQTKRVELPDINEVRRVNSSILTAQVAPIKAAALRSGSKKLSAGSRNKDPRQEDKDAPSRRELEQVLGDMTLRLRERAGMGGGGYCCLARRHRSVNDARKRINPGAADMRLHTHADGACACCCRHLTEEDAERERIAADVTRLQRDLRRLLRQRGGGGGGAATKKKKNYRNLITIGTRSKSPSPSRSSPQPSSPCAEHDARGLVGMDEWERQKALSHKYFYISQPCDRLPKKRMNSKPKRDSNTQKASAHSASGPGQGSPDTPGARRASTRLTAGSTHKRVPASDINCKPSRAASPEDASAEDVSDVAGSGGVPQSSGRSPRPLPSDVAPSGGSAAASTVAAPGPLLSYSVNPEVQISIAQTDSCHKFFVNVDSTIQHKLQKDHSVLNSSIISCSKSTPAHHQLPCIVIDATGGEKSLENTLLSRNNEEENAVAISREDNVNERPSVKRKVSIMFEDDTDDDDVHSKSFRPDAQQSKETVISDDCILIDNDSNEVDVERYDIINCESLNNMTNFGSDVNAKRNEISNNISEPLDKFIRQPLSTSKISVDIIESSGAELKGVARQVDQIATFNQNICSVDAVPYFNDDISNNPSKRLQNNSKAEIDRRTIAFTAPSKDNTASNTANKNEIASLSSLAYKNMKILFNKPEDIYVPHSNKKIVYTSKVRSRIADRGEQASTSRYLTESRESNDTQNLETNEIIEINSDINSEKHVDLNTPSIICNANNAGTGSKLPASSVFQDDAHLSKLDVDVNTADVDISTALTKDGYKTNSVNESIEHNTTVLAGNVCLNAKIVKFKLFRI